MANLPSEKLSRRERQIMDVIYQRGQASVAEVLEGISDPPSYSAVRALLAILVTKGFLKAHEQGPRYIYKPIQARQKAGRSAIHQVLQTFYNGSVEKAVAALLDVNDAPLSRTEAARLQALIDQARKDEKKK